MRELAEFLEILPPEEFRRPQYNHGADIRRDAECVRGPDRIDSGPPVRRKAICPTIEPLNEVEELKNEIGDPDLAQESE